jgi:hypothetical protein
MVAAMKHLDDQLLARYRQHLTWPAPDRGRIAGVPIIELAIEQFAYRDDVGYDFELCCMAHPATAERWLFVRIDQWDPEIRRTSPDIDYCIPLAYDGASEGERLRWTIGFGGGWSDAAEVALLVFDRAWRDFFARVDDRVVFANPNARSGALLRIPDRHRNALDAFTRQTVHSA